MSNNESDTKANLKEARLPVALAGIGFIAFFIVLWMIVGHHKAESNATSKTTITTRQSGATDTSKSTTTTTTDSGAGKTPGVGDDHTPNTLAPYNYTSSTLPKGHADSSEGIISSAKQLSTAYPRSRSNLTDSQYQKAIETATAFATADATGTGVDQFSYYYNKDTGPTNLPWMKDMTVQWAFATETVVGTVQADVWYQGTIKSSGQTARQVQQTIFLDKATLKVVDPATLKSRGVTRPIGCCVSIVN